MKLKGHLNPKFEGIEFNVWWDMFCAMSFFDISLDLDFLKLNLVLVAWAELIWCCFFNPQTFFFVSDIRQNSNY